LGAARLPDFFYKSSGLLQLFGFITRIPNFYAHAAVSILYMVLIGGIISVIYAVVYRMVGPSRYGPLDAPPPKIKTKKYTR
jgi:cobalamin synthase